MRYLLLLLILITACNEDNSPKYIQGNSQAWKKEIRYFQDLRTGLCFAERGYSDVNSFTCIPCDSLKRLEKFNVHHEEK